MWGGGDDWGGGEGSNSHGQTSHFRSTPPPTTFRPVGVPNRNIDASEEHFHWSQSTGNGMWPVLPTLGSMDLGRTGASPDRLE